LIKAEESTEQFCRILSPPVQKQQPNPPIPSEEQSLLIQEEVCTFLEKGTVTIVPNQESFYSTLFLVPKKGGWLSTSRG